MKKLLKQNPKLKMHLRNFKIIKSMKKTQQVNNRKEIFKKKPK